MTTISSTGLTAAEASGSRRIGLDSPNQVVAFRRGGPPSAEIKAEIEQRMAKAARLEAEANQREQAVKNSSSAAGMENHSMSLPNISDLSLENAKKSLGIAQVMIQNKEDAGVAVHGRYGNKEISNLNAYTAALKDYISKQATAATAAYQQMQDS